MDDEDTPTAKIHGLIAQDPALSAKLLRLINAAFYSSAGAGSITTVSRAIALMGFGFVVERFGLFLRMVSNQPLSLSQRGFSLWLGVTLLLLGAEP